MGDYQDLPFAELVRQLTLLNQRFSRFLDYLQPSLPPGRYMRLREVQQRIGCTSIVTLQRRCARYVRNHAPGVRYAPDVKGTTYEVHESVVEMWRMDFVLSNGEEVVA